MIKVASGSRIVRTALAGTALAALFAFVAAVGPTPHAQAATSNATVAAGHLGVVIALDDDDDWVQQQLQTDQENQQANQEAEEQNELATQEAQQAEQQGLMVEQQADGSFGFGQ
jgi:TolA-binding protein